MSDPLSQIVALLRPDLSFSKFIEAAGTWRVRRSEEGRPFFCAVLKGAVRLEVPGREPVRVSAGDFVLIPAAHDFASSSVEPVAADHVETLPVELRPNAFRLPHPAYQPVHLAGQCPCGGSVASYVRTKRAPSASFRSTGCECVTDSF